MNNKKARMPLLLVFLIMFTLGITAIIASFSVLDQLFLSVPHCEEVQIQPNNLCYDSANQILNIDITNKGEGYIDSIYLLIEDEKVRISTKRLESGEIFKFETNLEIVPANWSILPHLNRRGDCTQQSITINETEMC